jgi:hypothetical protein
MGYLLSSGNNSVAERRVVFVHMCMGCRTYTILVGSRQIAGVSYHHGTHPVVVDSNQQESGVRNNNSRNLQPAFLLLYPVVDPP